MESRPVLGISMGDPASIGPEVTAKAVADADVTAACRPIVIGDARVLQHTVAQCGLALQVNAIKAIEDAEFGEALINVFDLANVDMDALVPGEISAMSGAASFEYVERNIALAMNGDIDGTVTGPINKESINLAGHRFSGHTEIYAHYTDTSRYAMLLVEDNLRVVHVSTHVSLRQACDLVKKERVLETIELMHDACLQLGIEHPRIGVAGLNPHSSDGGLFGDEEDTEIMPAIEEARARGIDADGPIPSDTLFPKAIGGVYDGCVVMYHDQGHIPFKIVGFNWDRQARRMSSVRGVNVTLGLPIIRTSVDHGTAMEIAGQNVASADAMKLAIDYAITLFRAQRAKI